MAAAFRTAADAIPQVAMTSAASTEIIAHYPGMETKVTATTVRGTWRKSSRSAQETACVELSQQGAVRDSKNPDGVLPVHLSTLLAAVKNGRIG